jgi:hypothetical protein
MDPANKYSLGADVVAAIARAKNDFRLNRLSEYQGTELIVPHAHGAKLLEGYVGAARPSDPQGVSGKRRLVLKVQSGRITEMYFSDNHYQPKSWKFITDF